MAGDAWTDTENNLIIADYFAMLADDIAKETYNKAEHNRLLQQKIPRSRTSIEFKHQNISAVLKGLGYPWIEGYKPAVNYQGALEEAVARWLETSPLPERKVSDIREPPRLFIGVPPTLSNLPPPADLIHMQRIAQKFDVAGRDERNRRLGEAGEGRVLDHERGTLRDFGRSDLAEKVRWVSKEDGDGAGYDIASYAPDGRRRLIEVKTTKGWERTPFMITRNEIAVAEANRSEWCLVRVWNFAREARAFEIRPPLDAHVSLTATTFQASLH